MDSLRSALSDPNLAYLLLMLSVIGISIEILTPGLIIPSTVGIVSGVFAFVALSTLEVNPVGLVLIILSLGCFITEALLRSKGLITGLGLVSIVFGSFLLFKSDVDSRINPWLIACVTAVMSTVLVFITNRVTAAQRRKVSIGREAVEGRIAMARTELSPDGMVLYDGELWKASLDAGCAYIGEEVVITKLEGLKLFVTKKRG